LRSKLGVMALGQECLHAAKPLPHMKPKTIEKKKKKKRGWPQSLRPERSCQKLGEEGQPSPRKQLRSPRTRREPNQWLSKGTEIQGALGRFTRVAFYVLVAEEPIGGKPLFPSKYEPNGGKVAPSNLVPQGKNCYGGRGLDLSHRGT